MKLRDVPEIVDLVNGQDVVTAGPGISARSAAALMAKRGVGAVVVCDDGAVVGIFTERDLMVRVVAEFRDPDAVSLAEVMTPDPTGIDLDSDLSVASDAMRAGGFRHLPVMERDEAMPDPLLIGILSARDLLRILSSATVASGTRAPA